MKLNKNKHYILLLALIVAITGLLYFVATPSVARADGSFLCSPSSGAASSNDAANCINRIYNMSIVVASIAAIVMIIIAGYLYMFSGGREDQTKTAKSLVISSLGGIVILLTGFLLLKQINPNLLSIKTISPVQIAKQDWALPNLNDYSSGGISGGVGSGGGGGGCKNIEQGSCNKTILSACPGMMANPELALRICNQESAGGNARILSTTDRCQIQGTNEVVSFSIGLWQLNMQNSVDLNLFPQCRGVLEHVSPGTRCQIREPYNDIDCTCKYGSGGKAAYNTCVNAIINDPRKQVENACKLFNNARGWSPWKTSYNKCK